MTTYQDIIAFWFDKKTRPLWFKSTAEFDLNLREKYFDVYNAAQNLELVSWQQTANGALALVIVLDQFPLNMFRGLAKSFATEALSRDVAREAIRKGLDTQLSAEEKAFLYMPFMHSEDINDQEASLNLFNQPGLENNLRFAEHHHNIIKQFGRFPHRNKILGRKNSEAELNYLNSKEAFLG